MAVSTTQDLTRNQQYSPPETNQSDLKTGEAKTRGDQQTINQAMGVGQQYSPTTSSPAGEITWSTGAQATPQGIANAAAAGIGGNLPVNTAQPNPATVNATPATGAAPIPQNQPPVPPSAPTNGQVTGTLPGQTTPTTFTSADVAKQYGAALSQAQASGAAPQTAGGAKPVVQNALKSNPLPGATTTPNVDNFFQTNPNLQQQTADMLAFLSPPQVQTDLMDQMKKITTEQGVMAQEQLQLMNLQNVMAGSAEDLAVEVTKAGGFATDSQIQALAIGRNKTLLKQASYLQNQMAFQQQMVANDTSLLNFEKDMANTQFSQRLGVYQLVQQNQQNIQNAARDSISQILNMPGGLQTYASNPDQAAYAEHVMGFAPGTLTGLAQQQANQANLKNLAQYSTSTPYVITQSGEVQNTQTGQGYSSPEDFQAQTGMTLDQAGQKGLIKPLGQTTAQQQQNFDNTIKLKELGVSQYNAQTSRINANQPNVSVVDTGNGKMVLTTDKQGNIINQQPIPKGNSGDQELSLAKTQGNISLIGDMLTKLKTPTNVSVGPNFTRDFLVNPFTSNKADFIAGVQQLTSQLTLDSLIQAKAQGATFGALSEGELNILAGSASKIQNWAIKDNQGNVTGYNTSGASFRAELDRINDLAKLDYLKKGGDPSQIGVQQEADGSLTTLGSDGKVHILYSPQ